MKPMVRMLVPVAALSWVALGLIAPGSAAGAAGDPSATIGEVSCVDEDGAVTVDLEAGDADQTFIVLVDGASVGDDPETPVAAGSSASVEATGLEDGDHTVEVLLEQPDDAEDATIASTDLTVACDVAPEGPYTNAKGDVFGGCGLYAEVTASNKAIAGDTADLQPVDFEVVFTPTDDQVDDPTDSGAGTDGTDGTDPTDSGAGTDGTDGTDPTDPTEPLPRTSAVGVPETLDSFTLDAATQTYDRTFELGATGDLVLRSGDTVVASAHVYQCLVLPVEASGGGPAVPDTGF